MSVSLSMITLLFLGAQTDGASREKARALVDDGNASFRKGALAEALERFQKAYETFPSPKILLNIAEAHRALRQPVLAARHYDQFLDETGNREDAVTRRVAERLRELERNVGRVLIVCDEMNANVRIDQVLIGKTPARAWAVEPGPHTIQIEKQGFATYTARVVVAAGSVTSVSADLESNWVPPPPSLAAANHAAVREPPPPAVVNLVATPPPEAPESESITGQWWFWAGAAVLAATAVGIGVAAASGGDNFQAGGELGRSSTAGPEWIRL